VDDVINTITSEIKNTASEGLTEKQASAAAQKLRGASQLVGTDIFDAVDILSKRLGAGYGFDFITGFPKFTEKYNLKSVNAQAKEVFMKDPCVITVIMPDTERHAR
jgi:hypothetical protein